MQPYTPEQDNQYIAQLNAEIEAQRQSNAQQMYIQPQAYGGMKQNTVEWQLDFRQELEDFEHFLRNDVLKRDDKNNEFWIKNPDQTEIIMNDRGVNEILKQIRTFLNKNNVLSNYTNDEINLRMKRLSHALRKLIYRNYESYGMDTEYKLNHFEIIVINLISMIESSYKRAMGGEERRGLNETRFVQQTENLNPQQQMPMYQQQHSKKSIFKPWTWLG